MNSWGVNWRTKIAEYSNIAVNNQSEFNENCLDSELIDNFVGNIWHNKCKNCLAYKFPRESNFCCSNGLVSTDSVPLPKDPPLEYQKMFSQSSVVNNLVAYNNSLALTSMGCNTPQEIVGPQFKIFGKLYHSLGSLFPYSNDIPKFSQIYFYDNETATNFRLQHLPNLNYDTLYLDYQKAFDHCDQGIAASAIRKFGLQGKLQRISRRPLDPVRILLGTWCTTSQMLGRGT